MKNKGKIPSKLGNTHISLKIRGVFPLILSKSLDFVFFRAVNRNISAYIRFLSFLFIISRKFSAYEFSYLHKNRYGEGGNGLQEINRPTLLLKSVIALPPALERTGLYHLIYILNIIN
jgi:hypothetical protein